MTDVRETMERLEQLDLSKVNTVSELVAAMGKCSFGARMLGEVADTLTQWVQSESKPIIIYDGEENTPLYQLLQRMGSLGWSWEFLTTCQYKSGNDIRNVFGQAKEAKHGHNVLMVGNYSERYGQVIYERAPSIIFINQFGQTKPGQVKDGFFPNLIVADPNLIMPILFAVLQERINGEKCTVTELMARMSDFYPTIVAGAKVLHEAVHDPDVTLFLTLSGAMTIAKMGLLVCDMIDLGMVDYIASTGALMAHGLIEGLGLHHYKYDPDHTDKLLADQGINRVTDTLEPEENFDHLEEALADVWPLLDSARPISPSIFHRAVGKYLAEKYPDQRGILMSAYKMGVPVCVPAFHDSEIGNDLYVENLRRESVGENRIVMDMELDTRVLLDLAVKAKKMAIFTIGGGVPRNNTQNVAPLIEIINNRLNLDLPTRQFYYGCRIDPAPMFYGNLGGCTYSEGGSWRKFDLTGKLAEITADATIVWAVILKYVMENLGERPWRKQQAP